MNKRNQKGFTLIELLAVIVILGVLLAIAIPSVAKYINTAKKSTFIENVQSYATAARNELFLTNSDYQLPVSTNDATLISFKVLENALENGGKKSSYGAALDEKGYGIGTKTTGSAAQAGIIQYDALKEDNVVQVGTNNGVTVSTATGNGTGWLHVTVTNKYPSNFPSE